MKVSKLLILTILFLSTSCSSMLAPRRCLLTKAAFDIGSGSTKMVVAEVDRCKNKIKKILLEQSAAVTYKEDLFRNSNMFSQNILDFGSKSLLMLKRKAQVLGATEFAAMATSAFRTANNGAHALAYLSKKTGINVQVIKQEREASLGYLGAKAKLSDEEGSFLVWDIGGGSMQMTFEDDSEVEFYLGKLASVSFKEKVIKEVQKKQISSPNPLGKITARKAVNLAKIYAISDVPSKVKKAVSKLKIYGIGGVHYYSIRKQALKEGNSYNQKDVEKALIKRSKLNDQQIGGKYSETDVSNLALVLGYMQALGIKSVNTMKINMAHGMLLE